ncbi:hypothetical protein AYR61_07785 [Secundilactobacillus paracollinoides]|uniref:Uncharacterized protein n=1 Tax=Secundilactobacillus paracollinoides TaxID=240427 RepID=A0A1B2IYQ7_9LACO|nr:hypothetical protein AYR61_07785 [Secundilactobacillus paracollinoides]ANZ67182.1 hypothetical protein AYR63_08535 [Secundilactobacillus paracollinoides]
MAFLSELGYMQLPVFRNAFRLKDREPEERPDFGLSVRVGLHAAFCFPKRVSAEGQRTTKKDLNLAFLSELGYMQLSVFRNAFRLKDREPRRKT